MPPLNPFLYGKPVPPVRHVGRQDKVRTLFSRLYNGESTAIVGEPHIGKSSMLRYMADEGVRAQWLSEAEAKYLFTEIDCHMLPRDYTPADFWGQALAALPLTVPEETVTRSWQAVAVNQFASFALESFFRLLARSGRRLVLIIDEFDALLNHPSLKGEFFGALRSMATRTDGLVVIAASRLSVSVMNRLSQELSSYGSPFFNNVIEVRLLPFSLTESHMLIELTLADTGVAFSDDDYAYIHALAGWRPFLMQVAAAGLFETMVAGKTGEACYQSAGQFFNDIAAAHFDDFWRHLSASEQAAMILLTLGEVKGRVDGREFDTSDLGQMEWYGPELVRLHEAGMVEQVEQRIAIAGFALWQGARWRVASRGFVWWVTNYVVAGTRDTIGFDQWLRDEEYQGLFVQPRTIRKNAWHRQRDPQEPRQRCSTNGQVAVR